MKAYTDVHQSKKLADILPVESADMFYRDNGIDVKLMWEHNAQKVTNPCWSLAALIELLPIDLFLSKHYFLEISKMGDNSAPNEVRYYRFREPSDGANFGRITHISYSSKNLIDACYEMIVKLKELNLL